MTLTSCIIGILGHFELLHFNRKCEAKQECPLRNILIFRNKQVPVFGAQSQVSLQHYCKEQTTIIKGLERKSY